MSDYYTESQMQRIEQAAYDGAMLEAGKEWERQRYEFGATEAKLAERIAELELGLNNQTVHSNTLQKILTEKLDRIAELEAAQRWIPVSERLPELDQDVLAIVEGDIVTGHFYQQWDGEIYFSSDDEGAMMVATHWMPLPSAPESEDE